MPMRMASSAEDDQAQQNPLYSEILSAWQSEEACPELLTWKASLIEELTQGLESQEANIERAINQDTAGVRENLFSAPLYQAECARVRYVLTAYARARLRKIVKCAGYIASDDEAWQRLSSSEQRFCRRYLALCARHHHAAFLQDLPEAFKESVANEAEDCPPALARAITRPPPLDDFVFARVKTDLGEVVIDEDTNNAAYLAQDDIHVLQYSSVRPLVHSGDLELF